MQDRAEPTAPEICGAVDRVVASAAFNVPDRVAAFLRYVVEETLAGRSSGIKAYSVAVDVFGRDDTFDPQSDPVVRIEAARLRRALERYYLMDGQSDPVVIGMPKGGYVPSFRYRCEQPAGAAATTGSARPGGRRFSVSLRTALTGTLLLALAVLAAGLFQTRAGFAPENRKAAERGQLHLEPRLMVLPFDNLGADKTSETYAAAITDELVGALSSFKEVSVLGVQTSRSVNGADVAKLREDLQVEYLLEGSARTDADHVRVTARLIDTGTHAVVWNATYQYDLAADALFRIPAEAAAAVAGAIAQPRGVVFRSSALEASARPPDDLEAYLCGLGYYSYRSRPDPETHLALGRCLERTVGSFPGYATAWALLSHIYIDEIRFGFNRRESALNRALAAARRAVAIDPDNGRGLQALATALFFAGKPDEADAFAERALALNPNDSDLLGQVGQLFAYAGRKTRGRELIERALELNPASAGYYQGSLAFICYIQKDYACATAAIEQSDAYQVPTYYGIAAIVYAQTGRTAEARKALEQFRRIAPSFIPNLWAELSARNIPLEDQLHVAEGLRKTGASLPPPPPTH